MPFTAEMRTPSPEREVYEANFSPINYSSEEEEEAPPPVPQGRRVRKRCRKGGETLKRKRLLPKEKKRLKHLIQPIKKTYNLDETYNLGLTLNYREYLCNQKTSNPSLRPKKKVKFKV